MKINNRILAGVMILILLTSNFAKAQNTLPKDEVIKLAQQAYIYGLPLIFTDFTRQVGNAPNNIFSHGHKFPDHTSRLVVAPNNDTNYSSAFLDLGQEPVVLDIPDTKDRYYVVPLMDAWTNVFASFGKRTTGTKPQKYLITGPKWSGKVPAGLTEVKSPTDLVWIIGRIQVNSPEDQVNFVSPIQDQFTLTLLSNWAKPAAPKTPITITRYKTPLPGLKAVQNKEYSVVQAIKNIPVEDYFNYLNELLVKNPPLAADAELIKDLQRIGIGPGKKFDLNVFDSATQSAFKEVPPQIYSALDNSNSTVFADAKPADGAKIGDYKTNYVLRAAVAYGGLGALAPEEATYLSYTADVNKQPLTGSNKYVVHYDKGKLPPATAFWSLTMYGKDRYLVENPIRRYAIGDRNPLKYNADGSLDIYVQHDNPGKEKENNWLPAPADSFNVILRIYVPELTYLNDKSSWVNPPISKVK